ncbi:Arginyl-tRNA synthetase [Mortierella hygrophila]|uniref:Arginyl-tRNA synthetase n=1 Tax=Mortierella hygrophila TaxID=979708 RepID=A0A9P6FFJ4_9FUNG|nr:Arginyl-tRNA synthetase [Mortierella hygrophila]
MAESTLVSFRRAIATHLTGILGQSIESLLPLVQQNTSHRKASHSVFSVVIKRLQQLQSRSSGGGTTAVLDEQIWERCCTELSADTREYIVRVWRTKDMLLFDPQPLQLIQKAVGAIVERAGARERVGAEEEEEEEEEVLLLGKRAREELSSGGKKAVGVIVDGMKTLQDESAFSSLRRTVLTGFVARFLLSESNGASSVKVLADLGRDEFLQDLDVESPTLSDIINDSGDGFLETIKHALWTEPEIKAQWSNTEDGAWVVDMSAQKLGQVKVFSSSRTGLTSNEKAKEMGDPTVVVETLLRMARRFARYDGGGGGGDDEGEMRYIWVIPDGRRLFAEQVLFLARIIFPGVGRRLQSDGEVDCSISEDEPERKKRAGATAAESDVVKDSRSSAKTKSWADSVEVVYYGPAMGVDLPKDSSLFTAATSNGGGEMSEVIDYTNVKMREVVEQNRGGGGVGGYSGAYGNDGYDADDGDDEGDGAEVLDEAELTRMSNILSRSAVVVSCCGGKRARKLNISMSRILDGKGNSGVFLQYVLSRLYGIERKSKARLNASADLAHISSYTESLDLALLLAEYPEILSGIHESLDPDGGSGEQGVEGEGDGGGGCRGEVVGVLGGQEGL